MSTKITLKNINGSIVVIYSFFVLQHVVGINKVKECFPENTTWKESSSSNTSDSSSSKRDMNNILENISLQIKPPNNFFQNGRKIVNKVCKIVKRTHYDVDRCFIGGSVGKGTAINNGSDFDVVIFINNIEPPYPRVVDELKEILNAHSNEIENYKYRKTTDMLVKIKVSNIKFDIIPTSNYNKSNSTNFKEVLLRVQKLPNPFVHYYICNSALSEESASFSKRQSAFVHSVVHLAKYWNEKINMTEFMHGRSFRIEMIAIKSCEGVPENNIYLAFKKFLNMMADFEHLKIIFEEYYKISDIPAFILEYRGPIILDPVIYYSNLAHHWNLPKSAVMKYKVNAKISLRELEKWKVNPCANTNAFEKIFNKDYSSEFDITSESFCKSSEYYTVN